MKGSECEGFEKV